MWPYARRRRRPWPLLLALLQSTALLTPRPVPRGPRPRVRRRRALQPRTGGAGAARSARRRLASSPARRAAATRNRRRSSRPRRSGVTKSTPTRARRIEQRPRCARTPRPRSWIDHETPLNLIDEQLCAPRTRLWRGSGVDRALHRQFKDRRRARAALRRGTRHLPKMLDYGEL